MSENAPQSNASQATTAQTTTPPSTGMPHWLEKLCSSPMTGGRTLPTSLPPELRNNIYIEYHDLCPRAVLHQETGNVVPQGSLIRVNRQLRQEVGSLTAYFVTDLVVEVQDYRFEGLLKLLDRFDKGTVEGFKRPESALLERPTQAQLAVATRAQSLRSQRASNGVSGIRQYPALRKLVLQLGEKQATNYYSCYRWCRLLTGFAWTGRVKKWTGVNVGYEVVQGSNITPSMVSSLLYDHSRTQRYHPPYHSKEPLQQMDEILATFKEYVAATGNSG